MIRPAALTLVAALQAPGAVAADPCTGTEPILGYWVGEYGTPNVFSTEETLWDSKNSTTLRLICHNNALQAITTNGYTHGYTFGLIATPTAVLLEHISPFDDRLLFTSSLILDGAPGGWTLAGRWTNRQLIESADPLALRGGLVRYRYCGADPAACH